MSFTLITAMAVHVSDQTPNSLSKLQRCFRSIVEAQNTLPSLNYCGFAIHLAISSDPGMQQSSGLCLADFKQRIPNLYIYKSDEKLQQFQHYERILQKLELQVENLNLLPNGLFIMFSDGDDIWEKFRITHAIETLTALHAEGSQEISYVFMNARISESSIDYNTGSAEVTKFVYETPSVEGKTGLEQGITSFMESKKDPHELVGDGGWDVEYWSCITPFSVFQKFFDGLLSPDKRKVDRCDCTPLKDYRCDLAFGQFMRDHGVINTPFRNEVQNESKSWMYCQCVRDQEEQRFVDDICRMTILLSLSPK